MKAFVDIEKTKKEKGCIRGCLLAALFVIRDMSAVPSAPRNFFLCFRFQLLVTFSRVFHSSFGDEKNIKVRFPFLTFHGSHISFLRSPSGLSHDKHLSLPRFVCEKAT
ncbi:MAG: hypothetical protein FWF41_06005 [Betaproteobacteria bacterium]|nr:hypothetical protein [Betaproteobacteria bacterium]